jgi:hypothetical protein
VACLACDEEHVGQGLPLKLGAVPDEMLAASSRVNWGPGLLQGAYECPEAHSSHALKAEYLPKSSSDERLARKVTGNNRGMDRHLQTADGICTAAGRPDNIGPESVAKGNQAPAHGGRCQ